jgi:hypothetical protein
VGGGAWPFLVGGAICLVNSDNERDSSLLNRPFSFLAAFMLVWLWLLSGGHARQHRGDTGGCFLEGQAAVQPHETEQ